MLRLNITIGIIVLALVWPCAVNAENAQVTLRLWPDGFIKGADPKTETVRPDKGDGVIRISDVTTPTITLYPAPETEDPVPAVLVCPGGGYRVLSYNKEGTELAEWFNSIGVTALVLKYRVPENREGAFQDAQRAMGLIRQHADEWNIDPNKVGVMGFSAGGHLAASLSNRYQQRVYRLIDDADKLSCRPDFTMLIYPAYLSARDYALVDSINVTSKTPPCFLVQTQDDRKYVDSSIAYYLACKEAGVSAELHIFPQGGHGYGIRKSAHAVSEWPLLCADWLKTIPVLEK